MSTNSKSTRTVIPALPGYEVVVPILFPARFVYHPRREADVKRCTEH